MWDLLDAAAGARPGQPWLRTDDEVATVGEIHARARARAQALEANRVRPGDRVVVALPNSPEFVCVWFGLMALGGVLVAVNPTRASTNCTACSPARAPGWWSPMRRMPRP